MNDYPSWQATPDESIYRAEWRGFEMVVVKVPDLNAYEWQVFDDGELHLCGMTRGINDGLQRCMREVQYETARRRING